VAVFVLLRKVAESIPKLWRKFLLCSAMLRGVAIF
jgi:hypothetical protein